MNVVETQWWIIDLPSEWEAEQDDETIVIFDVDGVSEIALTTMQKESGEVSDQDLREFTQELDAVAGKGAPVSLSESDGYYFSYSEDNDALREWYLRYENLLIFITYSCDIGNKGMDDSAVDEILSTLFFKVEEDQKAP